MGQNLQNNQTSSRIRIVYSHSFVSLSLSDRAAFGDLAEVLGEVSDWRYGIPLGIDIMLKSGKRLAYRQMRGGDGNGLSC